MGTAETRYIHRVWHHRLAGAINQPPVHCNQGKHGDCTTVGKASKEDDWGCYLWQDRPVTGINGPSISSPARRRDGKSWALNNVNHVSQFLMSSGVSKLFNTSTSIVKPKGANWLTYIGALDSLSQKPKIVNGFGKITYYMHIPIHDGDGVGLSPQFLNIGAALSLQLGWESLANSETLTTIIPCKTH